MINVFNPLEGINAFAAGSKIGSGIRQAQTNKTLAPMVAAGDYKGAADYAGQRGDLGSAEMYRAQYQGQLAQMNEQQKAEAAKRAEDLARTAYGLKGVPYEQRRAALQQQAPMLQQMGIDPQELMQFDPTDQAIDGVIAQVTPLADLLKTQVVADGAQVWQGGRMVGENAKDPKAPATGMVQDENGNWVYSPEYLAGQKEIAALRGGNQGNVQSQFITDDGRLGYLRRDGSVEVTDHRVRNPFQITDVGGVPTAIDRLTGQGTQVTTPEAVGTNKATIETITANEAARQKAQQELPKAVATIDRGVATLEALRDSPGFNSRYGLASVIPAIPGTDMADTQALINQIGGQAFLTAFESLKGGGQITEIEGQKATQAITVLTTQGISVQMAARAIDDLIEVQKKAKERMSAQASGVYEAPGANQNIITYDPNTGFSDEN